MREYNRSGPLQFQVSQRASRVPNLPCCEALRTVSPKVAENCRKFAWRERGEQKLDKVVAGLLNVERTRVVRKLHELGEYVNNHLAKRVFEYRAVLIF